MLTTGDLRPRHPEDVPITPSIAPAADSRFLRSMMQVLAFRLERQGRSRSFFLIIGPSFTTGEQASAMNPEPCLQGFSLLLA